MIKFSKILLFSFIIALFSCENESVEFNEENIIEDPDPPVTESVRVKEAIGLLNGIEIVKKEYLYADNKLLSIKEFSKTGNDWTEANTYEFTYNGNIITGKFVGSPIGNRIEYTVENNRLLSISDFYNGEDLSGYDDITYSNSLLMSYIFYEGPDANTLSSYRVSCEYNDTKISKISEDITTPTNSNWNENTNTTFNYSGDQLTDWIFDYVEDDEFDEKNEYEYTNNQISKTTENSWNLTLNDWEKIADINYSYNSEGYLVEQTLTIINNGSFEETSNHLSDYLFDFELDTDHVKYTYEDGESNNYILLYPEFISHKTPNPYLKF